MQISLSYSELMSIAVSYLKNSGIDATNISNIELTDDGVTADICTNPLGQGIVKKSTGTVNNEKPAAVVTSQDPQDPTEEPEADDAYVNQGDKPKRKRRTKAEIEAERNGTANVAEPVNEAPVAAPTQAVETVQVSSSFMPEPTGMAASTVPAQSLFGNDVTVSSPSVDELVEETDVSSEEDEDVAPFDTEPVVEQAAVVAPVQTNNPFGAPAVTPMPSLFS